MFSFRSSLGKTGLFRKFSTSSPFQSNITLYHKKVNNLLIQPKSYFSTTLENSNENTHTKRQRKKNNESEINPDEAHQYLQTVSTFYPSRVLSYVENGWNSGKLPVTDGILKEYIKAAARMQKVDSINFT